MDFDAFERAGWDQKAGGYDRFFPAITDRLIEPLLDAAGVGPDSRLLDVGSGPGHLVARAAALGAARLRRRRGAGHAGAGT